MRFVGFLFWLVSIACVFFVYLLVLFVSLVFCFFVVFCRFLRVGRGERVDRPGRASCRFVLYFSFVGFLFVDFASFFFSCFFFRFLLFVLFFNSALCLSFHLRPAYPFVVFVCCLLSLSSPFRYPCVSAFWSPPCLMVVFVVCYHWSPHAVCPGGSRDKAGRVWRSAGGWACVKRFCLHVRGRRQSWAGR